MAKPIYSLNGAEKKYMSVYEDKVTIGNGFNFLASMPAGEKNIYYKDCIGIQFAESKWIKMGYLQVETASSQVQRNMNSPWLHENSFCWTGKDVDNATMRKVKEYIESRVEYYKNNQSKQVVTFSAADELKKYKELLDMGVLTQAEFDAKKKELLG